MLKLAVIIIILFTFYLAQNYIEIEMLTDSWTKFWARFIFKWLISHATEKNRKIVALTVPIRIVAMDLSLASKH